jgi:hypothetical protein
MIQKIKEYWQWFLGIVVTILGVGVLASRKRDSKTILKISDGELEKIRSEKIIKAQEDLYEKHNKKRDAAQKEFESKNSKIDKQKEDRAKELENNPEELDKILKEKYNLKG